MNVIITGATKGIGKAIADFFLKNAANIAICSRHQDDLVVVKRQWQLTYPTAQILIKAVDLSDKDAVMDFAKFINNKWEKVDVLINNAGVFEYGMIKNEPIDQLSNLLNINVLGVHYLTRFVLPFLKKPYGQIINICSIASRKPIRNSGSYSVSKYALLGYTENLREELREEKIKVTAVLPSATWSNSWEGEDIPKDRLMATEEVARTIWDLTQLDQTTVVEEIILRPPLGDI